MSPKFLFLILFLLSTPTTLFSLSPTKVTTTATSSSPHTYPRSLLVMLLSTLGYDEFANAVSASELSISTPITIFAPSDDSILSCSSFSFPDLVNELSLPDLYTYEYLQSLVHNRFVAVTSSGHKLFFNGMEITQPELFNNGLVIIHGVSGSVSHLSPSSCTPPFLPQVDTSQNNNLIMHAMLKDAIMRLRVSGYGIVSSMLQHKYHELMELRSVTIFALNDKSMLSAGQAYITRLRYHVVPNRRLTGHEMLELLPTTKLDTMEDGKILVVTTGGGGSLWGPVKVNFVKVAVMDFLHNERVVVHGIKSPFPQIDVYDCDADGSLVGSKKDSGMCMVLRDVAVPAGRQGFGGGDHAGV